MMSEEKKRKLAERREQIGRKNSIIYADWDNLIAKQRKETIELMRRRHAYYTKLIKDAEIKTAVDFYKRYREHFLMYGIELNLSENKLYCSIYLELGDYSYEQYHIEDGRTDSLAEVSPKVAFKELFYNLEVNIFTGEEL